MISRHLATLLIACSASMCLAQSAELTKGPSSTTDPLIVDVHAAPYRPTINYTTNISDQRFDMRHATILDIIQSAFTAEQQDDDREPATILGGPTWIDFDRFDLVAKIPLLKKSAPQPSTPVADGGTLLSRAENPYDRIHPVLKRVLIERFHMRYHMETRPLPGFVVTVAAGGIKVPEAKAPDAPTSCQYVPDKANPTQYTVNCTSEKMADFVQMYGNAFPHPLIDRTGLTKTYDFTLKLVMSPQMRTRDDMARLYTEAFAKQLGLVVTAGDVPQPALVVDSVERPTANAPDILKQIPTLPDLEFEVASIKPAAPNEPQDQMRSNGSQITFSAFNLQGLLTRAWQLPTGAMLGNAIPLLPPARYTILVKLPPEVDARAVYQDPDEIAAMLQKLLVDRFHIKSHWGEWTTPEAYVLLPGTPKMKRADPASRSFCKYGPADGEKTARTVNAPYDREFHCQNVTMAQFADLVQAVAASDVKTRVPDHTGLAGAYDFTVYYTSARTLRAQNTAAAAEATQAGEVTAAPVTGLALPDAFRKQIGLRLERQPLTLPALVLDHFDQTPSAN